MGKLKRGSLTVLLLLMSLSLIIAPLNTLSATAEDNSDSAGQAADTNNTDNTDAGTFDKLAENNSLAMYYNQKTGSFYIQNKESGYIWRSTPENYDADANVSADKKLAYDSQILVKYADKSGNIYEKSSKDSSVNKNGLKVKVIENGVLATYTFTKEGFVIPVEIKLTEDGLEVNVQASGIKETNDKCTLTGFSILPFFGAGGASANGYMFVPDGSGAIINYNNGKIGYNNYKQYIYGRDTSIEVKAKDSYTIDAKLPVFGVKNGDAAMLGVIHSGASRSLLNAIVTGGGDSFNTVYTEFIYRDYANASFNSKAWNEKDVRVFENNPSSVENYTVRYYFLPNDQANYTGMALRYQKYLQQDKKVESTISADTYPFYLNLFGSVRKLDNFLGFPVNKDIALTSYKDAQNILSQMDSSGVNEIVLKYSAWLKGGPDNSIPVNVNLSSALGGKKAFKSLTDYMSSAGIASFFDINLTDMYKDRFGYSRKSDSAKSLNNMPAMQYRFLPSIYQQDDRYDPLYLLKPAKVTTAASKVADKLKALNISGAALDTLGNKLYSSYKVAGMDRESTEKIWMDSIQTVKDSRGEIMMDAPNAYALPYVSYLSSVPVQSTGYAIEDYDVPFYQIAMHGLISYSVPAINQTSDYKKSILKAIETGSSLQFTWIAENIEKIQDTPYSTLYSANYADWIDDAIQSYKDISGVLKRVSTAKITGYDILQNGVVRTSYDNGVSVYVNYNDAAVNVDGVQVDGMSYKVRG